MDLQKLAIACAMLLGLLALAPSLASAQTTTSGASAASSKGSTALNNFIQKGNAQIQLRITALNNLNTRVSQMQEVSATFKQGLAASIATEIAALNSLQSTLDAATSTATARTDFQSITKDYRVYALVLPQGRIAAAADRVVTLVSMFTTIGTKLQTRIQADTAAGDNTTTLTAALNDLQSKIQDADNQAQAAVNATASLQPDQGVQSVMASNEAALKQGRTDLTTAMSDLKAARADVTTIVSGLKGFETAAPASSTTQTSSSTSTQ